MADREELRKQTTELLQRLRGEDHVPQELFELLDTITRRLDRLEIGSFSDPDEVPTKPERRVSSATIAATSKPLPDRVAEIFDGAKKGIDVE
jgi:hypothetical protein